MSNILAVLITLVTYKVLLIAIGLWATRRTRDAGDFFLGGRKLGPVVAAVSASASSSSAWTLLGVSGAAYLWGLPALWLFPATVSGFLINWLWVAPRMMRISRAEESLTLTEFIAGDGRAALRPIIIRTASVIIIFSFLFYIAAQFQAAGLAFASVFGLSMGKSIVIGGAVIIVYTLLGGFWAVSVTDTLQGLLMAVTAVILPAVALSAVGGFEQLWTELHEVASPEELRIGGPHGGAMAVGFVLGTLGIGLGYPGQPHVVNRFMALKDERALRRGRVVAIGWAVIIYSGMLLLGLCAKVLFQGLGDGEQVFYEVANQLLAPVAAGIMIAAVLSAIMSTADSQLLVATSSVAYDWRLADGRGVGNLMLSRVVVVLMAVVAIGLAVYLPDRIFSRVLFAWHAIGSAFGPLVLVRICGYDIEPRAVLGTLIAGFGLTVIFHYFPDTPEPGDFVERLVPFVVALAIALAGRDGRRRHLDGG